MTPQYWLGVTVIRTAARIFLRQRVSGVGNFPLHGPAILVCNHLSALDPPLVASCISRQVHYMAKSEFFHKPWPWVFFYLAGTFPVRRGEPDREAIARAGRYLQRGDVIGMFPEGTRSHTRALKKAYAGTAYVAMRTGAPICPAAITGTEKVRSLSDVRKRPDVSITFGEPFHIPEAKPSEQPGRHLSRMTDLIMARIAALLPEEYRGEYAETARISGSTDIED